MLWKIECHCDEHHTAEEEEEGVCGFVSQLISRSEGVIAVDLLNMNFSVGVSMYSENVT